MFPVCLSEEVFDVEKGWNSMCDFICEFVLHVKEGCKLRSKCHKIEKNKEIVIKIAHNAIIQD